MAYVLFYSLLAMCGVIQHQPPLQMTGTIEHNLTVKWQFGFNNSDEQISFQLCEDKNCNVKLVAANGNETNIKPTSLASRWTARYNASSGYFYLSLYSLTESDKKTYYVNVVFGVDKNAVTFNHNFTISSIIGKCTEASL